MMDAFATEVAAIREEITTLRTWGADRRAGAAERVLERLELARRRWLEEGLDVTQAASESGYSEDYLRNLARDG